MSDSFDPYKVLQVDPEAEAEVIQAAYRRLAQKYHPDMANPVDAAVDVAAAKGGATARMAQINEAWKILRDPSRRAAYDRVRRATRPQAGSELAHADGPAQSRPPQGRAPGEETSAPPETVSRDWTSGRSSVGGGYDASMHPAEGLGAAGPPPGNASGSVLNFGRFAGWSLGEIARFDLDYVEWLDRMPIGRPYRDEIDAILRRAGRRRSADAESGERRGLFRRR
jgi:curved DNA-binding protein CbpA